MLAGGVSLTNIGAGENLLCAMAETLSYGAAVEIWTLGRVGLIGPKPQLSVDKARCGFVVGQVFADSATSLSDLLEARPDELLKLAQGLNGSFCIILAEQSTGTVRLISDRYGSQQMFYALDDTFIFGSQVLAVLQSPRVSRNLDLRSLFEFLAFQSVFHTRTLEEGVALLPPASVLTFDGKCSITQYWERRHRPMEATEEEFAEEMAAIFSRTMSRVGGNRPAIMLSGGLDSRMAFAACDNPPRCLTMGDFPNSEYRIATKVARARGVDTELLQRDPDYYPRLVSIAARAGSGLYAFNHAHSMGFLDDCDNDVILHGYVPEVFFRGANLPKTLRKIGPFRIAETLTPLTVDTFSDVVKKSMNYCLMWQDPAQILAPDLASAFSETINESIDTYRRMGARTSENLHDQFLWFHTGHHSKYPSFLFQLAFRPFAREGGLMFDNDVLDLYLKMPVWARSTNRIWLKALSRLNRKIANVPNANTGWPPSAPFAATQVLNAHKTALRRVKQLLPESRSYASDTSWPDDVKLLRYNPNMRDMVAAAIDGLDPGLFNIDRLRVMFAEHMSGSWHWTRLLYLVLTFSQWQAIQSEPRSYRVAKNRRRAA